METKTRVLLAAIVLIMLTIFLIEYSKPPLPSYVAPENADSSPQDVYSPFPRAPELSGIKGYINAPSNLTLSSLRGKVVLIDFWTYSCINCIRTLPYLSSWHEKYEKEGLAIIGVHTPEFEFEKDYGNVQAAVEKFSIKYPVVLDSDYATWNAYRNSYWPRKYLIDAQGRIRYNHIGEGGYDETESVIVDLLSEAKNSRVEMNSTKPNATAVDFLFVRTPEIYFGENFRRAPLGNAQPSFAGEKFIASIPAQISPDTPYLEGEWVSGNDGITLVSQKGAIELIYSARIANIVAGSSPPAKMRVFLDGSPVNCADSSKSECTIDSTRLYAASSAQSYGAHRLRLEIEGSGFEIFTFTFG